MRKLLFVAVPAVAILALVGVAAVAVFIPPNRNSQETCDADAGPTSDGDKAEVADLESEQRDIADRIISVGKDQDVPPRGWQVGIQAGMTESGLRNLTHGDRDSLGIFQMRPSMGWGSAKQLHDVDYQIEKFYDTLDGVDGWQDMPPGKAAQSVERSAFPDRYQEYDDMAAYLVSHHDEADSADSDDCSEDDESGDASDTAQAAIKAAKSQKGVPYAWGGGDTNGPSMGSPPDAGVRGFDCSSLTMYAYDEADISLPRVAADQYDAGKHLPLDDAEPGDLVFWSNDSGNTDAIHHVGIYLGHNKVINAPESGSDVHVSEIWQDGLVKTVTRPGAET